MALFDTLCFSLTHFLWTSLIKLHLSELSQLFVHLHGLLGTSNPTLVDGLTWTMIRSMRSDCRIWGLTRKANLVKLSQALKVIQDSFQPITDLHTKRDLVKDVVYSSV